MSETEERQRSCLERIQRLERRLASLHDLGVDVGGIQAQVSCARDLVDALRIDEGWQLTGELLELAEEVARGRTDTDEVAAEAQRRSRRYYQRQHSIADIKEVLESGLLQRMLAEQARTADPDGHDRTQDLVEAFNSGLRRALATVPGPPQPVGMTGRIDSAVARHVHELRDELRRDLAELRMAPRDPSGPVGNEVDVLARQVVSDIGGAQSPIEDQLVERLRASLADRLGEFEQRLEDRLADLRDRFVQMERLATMTPGTESSEAGSDIFDDILAAQEPSAAHRALAEDGVSEVATGATGQSESYAIEVADSSGSALQPRSEQGSAPVQASPDEGDGTGANSSAMLPRRASTAVTAVRPDPANAGPEKGSGTEDAEASEGPAEGATRESLDPRSVPAEPDPETAAPAASSSAETPSVQTQPPASGSTPMANELEGDVGGTLDNDAIERLLACLPDGADAMSQVQEPASAAHPSEADGEPVAAASAATSEVEAIVEDEEPVAEVSEEEEEEPEAHDSFFAEVQRMLEDPRAYPLAKPERADPKPDQDTRVASHRTRTMGSETRGSDADREPAWDRDRIKHLLRDLLPELLRDEEIKQVIFALIATESVIKPGLLGDLTGLRRFLAKEVERAVQAQRTAPA